MFSLVDFDTRKAHIFTRCLVDVNVILKGVGGENRAEGVGGSDEVYT